MADYENARRFVTVPNPEALGALSDFLDGYIADFAVPMRTGYSLKVVADELFSNIVYYSKASEASILFRMDDEQITLVFTDDGLPYNPMEAEEPDITLGAEERSIGGLGLLMVKKMAESVAYDYADQKNRLTVVLSKTPRKKTMRLEDFDL